MKQPYICGPLTELAPDLRERVKNLYSRLGDICEEEIGVRAFVPHEHFDPVRHASFTPKEVDAAERRQVCELTSVLVVVAIEPTWGGGIEVEMAYRSGVPILLLKPCKPISRLLRGNPGITLEIEFCDLGDVEECLRGGLRHLGLPRIAA